MARPSRKVSGCVSFAPWAAIWSWKKKPEFFHANAKARKDGIHTMNPIPLFAALADTIKSLSMPVLIVMIAVAFVIVVRVMASRYKKVPPNAVGIFYGRKYKWVDPSDGKVKVRGFRIVAGGGSLLLPIVENLELLSTAAFQTEIAENDIPNRDNVKINV